MQKHILGNRLLGERWRFNKTQLKHLLSFNFQFTFGRKGLRI
jgi:hypothetical protein